MVAIIVSYVYAQINREKYKIYLECSLEPADGKTTYLINTKNKTVKDVEYRFFYNVTEFSDEYLDFSIAPKSGGLTMTIVRQTGQYFKNIKINKKSYEWRGACKVHKNAPLF